MSDYDKYFEGEFENDTEVDEALDSMVLSIAEIIKEQDSRTSIINPRKLKEISFVYKAMKILTKGTNVKVTYDLHEPLKSIGSVTITGKNIVLRHRKWFDEAIKLASNFDVYPKTDGTVVIDFTFHGLTVPIED